MGNDCENDGSDEDDYGIVVPKGTKYLRPYSGTHFYKAEIYKLCKKQNFLYKESIIYPSINFKETKGGLVLGKGNLKIVKNENNN